MTPEESLRLIKANLAEILNPEIIDNVVLNEKRPLEIYWGTATTGKPHCGYFVPMVKIAELLVYQDIDKLKQDYEQDILTPQAIKPALIQALN
ncbi:hypothetical protein ACHAPZ_001004 [Fusarium culmorum]